MKSFFFRKKEPKPSHVFTARKKLLLNNLCCIKPWHRNAFIIYARAEIKGKVALFIAKFGKKNFFALLHRKITNTGITISHHKGKRPYTRRNIFLRRTKFLDNLYLQQKSSSFVGVQILVSGKWIEKKLPTPKLKLLL